MIMRCTRILIYNLFILSVFFFSVNGNAATFIYFNSDPGDYIGQGQEQTLTTEDGTINGSSSYNVVHISFDGSTWWDLYFAAPQGEQVVTGSYENATRYPFQSPVGPGLSVSGDGRGCNTLTGRFDVLEAVYTPSGQIERFAADFEQHCEGEVPALFGSVRYNATVAFPLKVDIEANGSHTPIIVNVGDDVEIGVSTDAGDDEGILGEYWLGMSGTFGTQWFNGRRWVKRILPRMWMCEPITTQSRTFKWIPEYPGVFLFQFVVDEQIDLKLNTQFVDEIIVTVEQEN
jgi:hypothetical protein